MKMKEQEKTKRRKGKMESEYDGLTTEARRGIITIKSIIKINRLMTGKSYNEEELKNKTSEELLKIYRTDKAEYLKTQGRGK